MNTDATREQGVPDSAAASLLLQARNNQGYGYSSGVDSRAMVRLAVIGLCRALVAGQQLDLKAPVAEDPYCSTLPLPAAWSTIENPHQDRVAAWAELDSQCLAVETPVGPSFKVAVISSLARQGKHSGSSSVVSEDGALAEWARHVPASHCQSLDSPGDDPAAGLLDRLRSTGHFVQLEAELAKKGFNLDGCLANGTPTAIQIHSKEQWDSWLEAGGDPTAIVPASVARPSLTVWEYQGLNRPAELLPSIRAWAEQLSNPPAALMPRLEGLEFWHRIDNLARTSSSRDDFVSALRDMPGWEEKTDDWGRNVLQRTLGSQPAFLTTCVRTAKYKGQVKHRDAADRDIWHYALPTLMRYNRAADAKSMSVDLAKIVPPTRQGVDGNRQRGVFIDLLIDNEINPPLPSKSGYNYQQSNRAPDTTYSKLSMSLDVLLGGSAEDQDRVARHILSNIDPKQPKLTGFVSKIISDVQKGVQDTGAHIAVDMTPSLSAALMYALLCPYAQYEGSAAREALVSSKLIPVMDSWLRNGVQLPVIAGQADPFDRFDTLDGMWQKMQVSLSSGASGLRPQVMGLLDNWRQLEEGARMERKTAPAQAPSRALRL